MRARYYNTDIKRFINRDILSGDISNNQSLNEYCYVQGNPIKLTDPFGLCPGGGEDDDVITWGDIGHGILDALGIFIDAADIINAVWYALEGDYYMAATSAICMIPGIGSFIGLGAKAGIKGMRAGVKISSEYVQQMFKTMSHTFKSSRAMGKLTDGIQAAKKITKKIATSAMDSFKRFANDNRGFVDLGYIFGKNADEVAEGAAKGGKATTSNSEVYQYLLDRPELTGTNREKLLSSVQNSKLASLISELYRPGATVGDGGTADILVKEFYEGTSKH